MRHNATPPEVSPYYPAALPPFELHPPSAILCYPFASANRLPPDYRLQREEPPHIAFLHALAIGAYSYFTYFFSYGIFLPFWSVWSVGSWPTPEPSVSAGRGSGRAFSVVRSLRLACLSFDPQLRSPALLTLVFALAFGQERMSRGWRW